MIRYSIERKEALLKKLLPPHNMTVAEIARNEGISPQTLYRITWPPILIRVNTNPFFDQCTFHFLLVRG